MSPFLGIKHEFLATRLAFVLSNSTMTESVGIVIPFVTITVGTVNALVQFSVVSFRMSSEITLIEETTSAFWYTQKKLGLEQ